jgi:cyclophilin family peptidyl-prolyl cis-trans isomerase
VTARTSARRRLVACASLVLLAGLAASPAAQDDADGPVLVVETTKGTFTVQTYPEEAPLTVAHIVTLADGGFYDGQRIHRVVSGVLVQFGDPRSRDESLRDEWGLGPAASSGQPIGAAEITKALTNRRGAVGVAHPGDPMLADSQIYVLLGDRPALDGQYAVFGRVASGEDVPAALQVGDLIQRVSVRR